MIYPGPTLYPGAPNAYPSYSAPGEVVLVNNVERESGEGGAIEANPAYEAVESIGSERGLIG